jgi:hypothetical protein
MTSKLRELAYRVDPVLWVRDILGVEPTDWQQELLRALRGASILALTARQCGKTTTAAWAMAHGALYVPGSLSVVACPAQRQSAEAVRRVRGAVLTAGGILKADNVYGLELQNGSRVLALPGSDDSIRGLTVDAWIVADEAARLSNDLIAALRPMRARRPETRFAMLSTAWSLRTYMKGSRSALNYDRVAPHFFAVSMNRNGTVLYRRCNFSGNRGRTMHCIDLAYPVREKRAWDSTVTRISRSLRPLYS